MFEPFRRPRREGRPPRVPLSDPGPMLWALRDLGYLASDAPVGEGDGLSGAARAAILRYGRVWLGEQRPDPVRPGALRAVAEHLGARFCAVPDVVGAAGDGLEPLVSGSASGPWRRGDLTWTLDANSPTGGEPGALSIDALSIDALASAFASWSEALPSAGFRRVAGVADITVRLGGTRLTPFLGRVGGVRAAAGPPPAARVQVDLSDGWAAPTLFRVALHEIGHVLGLPHSTDPASVMSPQGIALATLDAGSVAAVRAFHGS